MRPYTSDYLAAIAPDFQELHGDRMFADDPAIIGGIGRIDGRAVAELRGSCVGALYVVIAISGGLPRRIPI